MKTDKEDSEQKDVIFLCSCVSCISNSTAGTEYSHPSGHSCSPLTTPVTIGLERVEVPCSAYSHHLLECLKVPLAHLHSIISIILEILAQVLLNSGFSGAWTGCVQMDIAQALSTTVDTIKELL